MASEDLFAEDISEEIVPEFDNEIEEVTEEVEATETTTEAAADDEAMNENESLPAQKDAEKQKQDKSSDNKLYHLPLAKIRTIMKLDPDLHIASNEAVFCVTRATELFIASMAQESFHCTTQTKKKTIQKRDVDQAIESVETLEFLVGSMF